MAHLDSYSQDCLDLLPIQKSQDNLKISNLNSDSLDQEKARKAKSGPCPPLRYPKLPPARSPEEFRRTRTPLQMSHEFYGEEEVEGKPRDVFREMHMYNYERAIERKILADEEAAALAEQEGRPIPDQPLKHIKHLVFRKDDDGPNWNLTYTELSKHYQRDLARAQIQNNDSPQSKSKTTHPPEPTYNKADPILAKHAKTLDEAMRNNRLGDLRDNVMDYKHMRMQSDQLARENYDLKVRMIHLEARLDKTKPYYMDEVIRENVTRKLQVRELDRELKRQRILVFHHEEYIKKLNRTEAARKVCFNPIKGTTEEEREMHKHLQESNKCHFEFKRLQKRLEVQEAERKMFEEIANKYRKYGSAENEALVRTNAAQLAEILELKRYKVEAEALKAENQRLIAENAEIQARLQEQTSRNDRFQQSPRQEPGEEGLLHTVTQLQDEVYNLSSTHDLLTTDIAMYQQEVQSLKDQLSQALESSPAPAPSNSEHTQLLIENLRNQLEAATRPKAASLYNEPCATCTSRFELAYFNYNIPLSLLAEKVIDPSFHDRGQDFISNMLCLENHFFLLIDKLRVSMTIDDASSRNELIEREISDLENICQRGLFPKASQALDLEKNCQAFAQDLEKLKEEIKTHQGYSKIKQDSSADSIASRDDLLRKLLDDLALLVPVSAKCDPADNFEQFQAVIKGALLAASHLFNDKVKLDVHQANEELKVCVRDLEKRLQAKSKELDIATEKVEIHVSRYNDLKEKAMILKNRLAQAKILNDETKKQLYRLESEKRNSGSYSPGSPLDSVSVDE